MYYSSHVSMWALCCLNPRSKIWKKIEFLHKSEWFFTIWNANTAAHGTNKQAMIVVQATLQPFFTYWVPMWTCRLLPESQIEHKKTEFLHKAEWFSTMWNANSAAHGTNKQAMIVIQATLQPFFTLLSLVVSKVIVRGVIILWPTLERQAAACFCLFLLPQLSWD